MCRTTTNRELICVTVYSKGIQYLIVNGETSATVLTEIALNELARVTYNINFSELESNPPIGTEDYFTVAWYRKG